MNTLLALDPGGTTGWSCWEYDALTPLRPIAHGQIVGGVRGFVAWWGLQRDGLGLPWDEVVSESFVLDGRTPNPNIQPLRIEGALEVLWPGPMVYQRNTFKSHLRDERIKDLGLWWKGQPHAIDSMRHAFALMKVRKHAPTIRMAWPQERRAAA